MQGEQVWTWHSPICGIHVNPILDGFTVPGRPLARERAQSWESKMVPWLLVLVLSRPVPRSQSELSAGWRRGEWVQVYNPCRVKTIRIAAYSVMYIPTLLLLPLVSVT